MELKMAFLGLFNYNKPGPGVDKGETNKTRFFYFFELYFRKFWKLMGLNLLFLLFCIPIVTIGPAIAGMTYVLRNYANEKPTFMVSDFFDAFKSNWKQSTALFFLDLIGSAIVGFALYWYMKTGDHSWGMMLLLGGCLFAAFILFFMRLYTYLMAVTVDLKFKDILKNAWIFSIVGLRTNFITFFFTALIAVPLIFLLPPSFPVIVLLGFSTIGFISVFNSYPYIIRYMVEPYEQKIREEMGEEADTDAEAEGKPIFTDIGSKERPLKGTVVKKGKILK
ncbi:MAG: DUF624 domain-containing protein [Oscillospiraceae bacterium]